MASYDDMALAVELLEILALKAQEYGVYGPDELQLQMVDLKDLQAQAETVFQELKAIYSRLRKYQGSSGSIEDSYEDCEVPEQEEQEVSLAAAKFYELWKQIDIKIGLNRDECSRLEDGYIWEEVFMLLDVDNDISSEWNNADIVDTAPLNKDLLNIQSTSNPCKSSEK